MESQIDAHTALAMLDWQIELGADEAICDAPVDRYALGDAAPVCAELAASVGGPCAQGHNAVRSSGGATSAFCAVACVRPCVVIARAPHTPGAR